MTQYVINIGALPNDGTGDPLRTAFNEVNLNFNQVWATGLVGSNIQVANNTILTTNTNGNLVLAPNGVGNIIANVNILPNGSNIRSLGSSSYRWDTIYVQYANISGNLDLAGTFSVGDLSVTGNLTVTGNTIQIGNLITDAKTIQLANTAGTANAANGSGVTVGANDSIATLLYNSTSNTWTTNIGMSSVGNVTAPYFFGNGSQLTGIVSSYGNSNVAAYLPTYSGNISGGNIGVSGAIDAVGEITSFANIVVSPGGFFQGDGSQLTNLPNSGFPIANGTSNINIATANGNVTVTADGSNTWTFDDSGVLSFPSGANISNNAFSAGTPSATVALNAYSPDGNTVTIQAQGNSSSAVIETYANGTATTNTWTFGVDGTTTFPNYTILTPIDNDLIVTVQDDSNDDWALYNRVTDTGVTLGETRLKRGQFQINFPNAATNFNFDDSGILGLPGDIALNTQGGDISLYAIDDGDSGSAEIKTISYAGGTLGSNVRVTQNNATISTSNAGYTWTFDNTGNLTIPPISTGGEGEQERATIKGTRKIIGEVGTWSTSIPGHTTFGNVVWTASSSAIQSAKITFVVQSNGVAFNWEQFDVSVCKFDGANAFVSVSGRIKQNSAIADTEVSAYENEGGLEVWLNPADGQTVAYINYNAVEFNIMPD